MLKEEANGQKRRALWRYGMASARAFFILFLIITTVQWRVSCDRVGNSIDSHAASRLKWTAIAMPNNTK